MPKTVEQIRNEHATMLHQRIPYLTFEDALILSQAKLALPVDDEQQPEGAYEIADRVFNDVDIDEIMAIDDDTHQMLYRWFVNTCTGALRSRLDKLAKVK